MRRNPKFRRSTYSSGYFFPILPPDGVDAINTVITIELYYILYTVHGSDAFRLFFIQLVFSFRVYSCIASDLVSI